MTESVFYLMVFGSIALAPAEDATKKPPTDVIINHMELTMTWAKWSRPNQQCCKRNVLKELSCNKDIMSQLTTEEARRFVKADLTKFGLVSESKSKGPAVQRPTSKNSSESAEKSPECSSAEGERRKQIVEILKGGTGKLEESAITVVKSYHHFKEELEKHSQKFVVINFSASSSENVASSFEHLPVTYPEAAFLKADVHACGQVAEAHDIPIQPAFIFIRDNKLLGFFRGTDERELNDKIRDFIDYAPESEDVGVPGYINLLPLVDICRSECVDNAIEEYPYTPFLMYPANSLESDLDPQFNISYVFTRPVRLHSLKIKAPTTNGPRRIKLFANPPVTMSCAEADENQTGHEVILTEEQLTGAQLVDLNYDDFGYVENLQIFVADNQVNDDITRIDNLVIIGLPIDNAGQPPRRSVDITLENTRDLMRARGHIDLSRFIDADRSDCENDDIDNEFKTFIRPAHHHNYLVSETGPRLIMSFVFTQPVNVYSLLVRAPASNGPRRVQLFTSFNMDTCMIRAEDVESLRVDQELILTSEQLRGELVDLDSARFQNIEKLLMLVSDYQSDLDVTRIDNLSMVGLPVEKTDVIRMGTTTFQVEHGARIT